MSDEARLPPGEFNIPPGVSIADLERDEHRCPACGGWDVILSHSSGTNRYGSEEDYPSVYTCMSCPWEVADYTPEWDAYVAAHAVIDEGGAE